MGNKRKSKTLHSKKVMFVIFFTNQGHTIQIAVPMGKSVNAKFYKGKVLYKLKKYFKTVDEQLVFVVSGYCMAMLGYTKRLLYENI
jgi:hypothetical protein